LQWIHVTGKHGDVEKARKMYQKAGFCACVIPYEEQMGYLWTAADFAVTRAGSGVLQELTESLTPAVVVPFPRSADGHQQKNAEFFQDVIGGGVTCVQETEELCRQLTRFLEEPSFIETCKSRMLEYRQSLKYHSFSESVCKVLGATT
jgi:UDP-N-acetylglucosamine--N-acetylmuramyl-(pentapeptide) pyrophosphoryl-undecaprenol N-acetylglucosamine transferase